MKETQTFPPNQVHGDSTYYLPCLLLFIAGLKANETHGQIAARLNAAGLKTPTGALWSAASLKSVLQRIRCHREFRSSFHAALMRLVFDGHLTVPQTLVLFQMRTNGGF